LTTGDWKKIFDLGTEPIEGGCTIHLGVPRSIEEGPDHDD
jgi:hypothetical protein